MELKSVLSRKVKNVESQEYSSQKKNDDHYLAATKNQLTKAVDEISNSKINESNFDDSHFDNAGAEVP